MYKYCEFIYYQHLKRKKRLETLDSLGWTVGSQMALRSSFSFASSVVFPALSRPRNSTLPFLECKPTSKARACAGSEHSGIGNVWRAMGTVHSKCAETCMWWHLKPTDTQFDAVADNWTYQAWLKKSIEPVLHVRFCSSPARPAEHRSRSIVNTHRVYDLLTNAITTWMHDNQWLICFLWNQWLRVFACQKPMVMMYLNC